MWQVENRTPFAAEGEWVRDRSGAEVWLVAVKCTFDITPDGTTVVSDEQPPVLRVPEYHGEPGKSSLKYETDLVRTKTTTDITVVGHACPPRGNAATELDVGFRVGPVQKLIKVFGNRYWRSFGRSRPEAFTRMPLVYERAFGGPDVQSKHPDRDWEWRNPVGTGFVTSRDHAADVALPNLEYPDALIRSWSDRPRPAGFGPLGCHWQPRVAFAGTYGDRWMKERQPLLPEDFDDRFFQCAPTDQQAPAFLRGGEDVVLLGLNPAGELRFFLPKVFLGFDTRFYDGSRKLHQERTLHSVILEPDYPRVSVVWHSSLPCHFKVQKLDRTIVTVKRQLSAGEPAGHSAELGAA